MITRRRTLATIAAALAAPFVSREAAAEQPPTHRPLPQPPRKPDMTTDIVVIRQADALITLPPIFNKNGTTPDITTLSAKLSVKDAYGGSTLLADIGTAISSSIVLATNPNGGMDVTLHWTPAQTIANGSLTGEVIGVGDLHITVVSTSYIAAVPLRVTLLPGVTTGS